MAKAKPSNAEGPSTKEETTRSDEGVFTLRSPQGKEYRTSSRAEAHNRVVSQGFELVSPKEL